ncbi:MAG: PAS domain-containing protein [Akkermansiaceae bacterium]|nr:PAS domain-containing protein [Akkermansiaceae bacterium]
MDSRSPKTQSPSQQLGISVDQLLKLDHLALLHLDGELQLRGFNEQASVIFRLLETDIGNPIGTIPGLGAQQSFQDSIRQDQSGHVHFEFEGRLLKATAIALSASETDAAGIILFIKDITDYHQPMKRLLFALNAAFMNWWEWNLVVDHARVHTDNHQATLLGFDSHELPKTRKDWEEMVHPDDREYVLNNLETCLSGDDSQWFCECRMKTVDGGWIWVDIRGTVTRCNREGRPLEMMGTAQDIDTSKRAQIDIRSYTNLLQQAGEIAKLGTWEYYPENGSLEWSRQTRKILGVDFAYEPSPEGFHELLAPDDAERARKAFEQALEDGTDFDLQLSCVNHKQEPLIIRYTSKTRFDLLGKLVRVTGIIQDITGQAGEMEE